jgi:hypothetical protein
MHTSIACISTVGMVDGDRFLHVAPLYHAAELSIMLVSRTAAVGRSLTTMVGTKSGARRRSTTAMLACANGSDRAG